MDKINSDLGLYPIAIRQARYSGAYEGGEWIAIPNYDEMSIAPIYLDYIDGDDDGAICFWNSELAKHVGVGTTPNDALEDLLSKHITEESSEYRIFRDKFNEHVESRKQHFTQRVSNIMNTDIERTTYYQQSFGYSSNIAHKIEEENRG